MPVSVFEPADSDTLDDLMSMMSQRLLNSGKDRSFPRPCPSPYAFLEGSRLSQRQRRMAADAETPAEAPVQKKDAHAWAKGEAVHLEGSDTTGECRRRSKGGL